MPFEHPLKNAYIGEAYKTYTPTANTISYLPMREDTTTTDYGSLNWTWTVGGTAGSYFKDNYWHGAAGDYLGTGYNTYSTYSSYTCICWVRCPSGKSLMISETNYGDGDNGNFTMEQNLFNRYNGSNGNISFTSIADGNWHMLTLTGASGVGYVDGVKVGTNSRSVNAKPRAVTLNAMRLNTGDNKVCDYSDLIIENRTRTATEILNHYNTYKGNYGL